MKSILHFEEMEISDDKIDEAGVKILNKMIVALQKLELYELSDNKRDAEVAINLSNLIDDTIGLRNKYQDVVGKK